MNLKDQTIAAVRTGWNGAVAAALSYLAVKLFDVTLDVSDPLIIAAAAPVLGVINRVSSLLVELARQNKTIGFILFGIPRAPSYTQEG